MRRQGFELEWFISGLDVEVKIAPGAPPQRLKDAVITAVGKEAVVEAKGLSSQLVTKGCGIAITFVQLVIVEGFGVRELNLCAFSAGDGEYGVGSGEGFAIEGDVYIAMRGNRTG